MNDVLKRRYRIVKKGQVLNPDASLKDALGYCLHGLDEDLDIFIGDYRLELADGTGWPSGIKNREHPTRTVR